MGINIKPTKPFLTYEQQIIKLRDEKHLEIPNPESAIKLLKEHSYFDLISGYKAPFKKAKNSDYKLHTSIQDIYSLYIFDADLRSLFLQYILKVEKHVKSLISYSFCEAYGEAQQHYLNAANYNYTPANQVEINELITRLTQVINDSKNYSYIRHQKNVYGNIPLWVLMKALTLGTVSKLYSYLPQRIQQNVSKEFDYVHENKLIQMLDLLARVRNVCAHNERLYDYRYRKGAIDDTYIHQELQITKKNAQYTKGKNDLFAVVIVLKYVLSENDFTAFTSQLKSLIEKLLASTKQIERAQLLKYMGFPSNWFLIKDCKKENKEVEKNIQ